MRDYRRFISADGWDTHAHEGHESDQQKGVPPPPVQKPYPADAELIALVAPDKFGVGMKPLREILLQRESRRKYSDSPLTLEELSFLLYTTQGVRRVVKQDGSILRTFRTVPSAGSRHPLETYLVVNNVTDLDPALYRYIPLEHKLLLIRTDPDLSEQVGHACCEQPFIGRGAVIFIWTTIPYRAEWRYKFVSHKMIAQDSGHVCQNLYLAAEAIDAGVCAISAYHQKPMDALIGVDGEDEFVVYLSPVGKTG